MSGPACCAFCDNEVPTDELRRQYELDFCERCALDVDSVITLRRAAGDAVQVRQWTTTAWTGRRDVTFYHFEVSGVPRVRIPVRASFTREGAWERLKKLLIKEVQIGDPMFDEFIYVGTDDRKETHAFLQHSGVQSVLMDLVSGYKRVSFEYGAITVHEEGTEEVDVNGALLTVCAMLVHAERMARSQS